MRMTHLGRAAVCAGLSLSLAMATLPTIAIAEQTEAQRQLEETTRQLEESQGALEEAQGAAAAATAARQYTAAELEAARTRLNELNEQVETKFGELEEQQAQLEDTRAQIGETEEAIAQKEVELGDARSALSENMADNYKNRSNVLSFLLGATSFEDLTSRVYYADKVAEHQSDAIATVLDIQSELDQHRESLEVKKGEQEELTAQTQQTAQELQGLAQEQQTYVDGLSEEVQSQLAAEAAAQAAAAEAAARVEAEQRAKAEAEEAVRQEEEERKRQEEERKRQEEEERKRQEAAAEAAAQAQAQATQDTTDADADTGTVATTGDDTATTAAATTAPVATGIPAGATPTAYTPVAVPVPDLGEGVDAAIAYAKSQLGVSYSWSGSAIAYQEFDCSGLVWWSFNQAGIHIPRGQRMSNGYGNSMIGWVLARGGFTTSQANLKAGDLMFWGGGTGSTTHVGLCIGDGQMIHSNWGGVEITSIYYGAHNFVGGGPIV